MKLHVKELLFRIGYKNISKEEALDLECFYSPINLKMFHFVLNVLFR